MDYPGLTDREVQDMREKYGSNTLPEPKLKSGFQFFIETFQDKLNMKLMD